MSFQGTGIQVPRALTRGLWLAAAVSGLLLSATSQRALNAERVQLKLTRQSPLTNAPPMLAFTTVVLGGSHLAVCGPLGLGPHRVRAHPPRNRIPRRPVARAVLRFRLWRGQSRRRLVGSWPAGSQAHPVPWCLHQPAGRRGRHDVASSAPARRRCSTTCSTRPSPPSRRRAVSTTCSSRPPASPNRCPSRRRSASWTNRAAPRRGLSVWRHPPAARAGRRISSSCAPPRSAWVGALRGFGTEDFGGNQRDSRCLPWRDNRHHQETRPVDNKKSEALIPIAFAPKLWT